MPELEKNTAQDHSLRDYVPYLLAQAHRNIHLGLEKILKREGVQVEHWRILDVIHDEKGYSMGELAELVLMNHPALTKMMDKMVAKGLVHRLPDPEDQRRMLVFITDQGINLFSRLKAHVDRYNQEIHTKLGPQKLNQLTEILQDLS